jgi:tetratricopeptide (TPR) repeat protein
MAQAPITATDFSRAFARGEELRLRGEFDSAIPYFRKSLDLAQKAGLSTDEIRCHWKIGLLNWNIGKVNDAADQFQAAKLIADRLGALEESKQSDKILKVIGYYKLGKKSRDETRNDNQSLFYFDQAIQIADEIANPDLKLKCLRQKSVTYFDKNDLINYFRLNQEALSLAIRGKNERDQGNCLNNLGIYYLRIGEYSTALNDSEKALDIARKFNNPQTIAEALNNLSIIYTDLGEFNRSIHYLIQVLDLDKSQPDREKTAMDYNNIGIAYKRKGLNTLRGEDFSAAVSYLEKALEIAAPGKNAKIKIKILNNLGSVFAQTGRTGEALERFQSALAIAEQTRDAEGSSIILNNIGIVYSNLGDYPRSTSYYQKAIDLATKSSGKSFLWELYLDLANSQSRLNLLKEAEMNYQASIAIIEDIRSSIDAEELKATYFGSDKRMDAYHNLIGLYVQREQALHSQANEANIFEYLEKAKARAFLDSLEVSNIEIAEPADAQHGNQEKSIVREITQLYRNLLMPGRSEEQAAAFREKIGELESQLDRTRREIRAANPNYSSLKYPHIASLKEAQKAFAQPGTIYLAYSIGNESSFGFAISPTSIKSFPLPPRAVLKASVEAYLKVLSDKDRRDFKSGFDLYRDLVAPAITPEAKSIIIIPDDFLYYLPFEALPTNAEGRPWLIERQAIHYAPSVSSLLAIQAREKIGKGLPRLDLLAIGAPEIGTAAFGLGGLRNLFPAQTGDMRPLQYAADEINGIADLFPARKETILLGKDASEADFKVRPLSQYRILHFATHGFIDDGNPSRSAIVLSMKEDSLQDGLLQTREIFDLRTNAGLVVLSACQTGLGRLLRGEGMEGLNRAFFYSGASSVLMTLWSINDQAGAQFMKRFYSHLISAESITRAQQEAKLDMIASPYFAHPFYWAGYILNGDGDRILFEKRSPLAVTAIAGGGLAFLFIIIMRKKRRGRNAG